MKLPTTFWICFALFLMANISYSQQTILVPQQYEESLKEHRALDDLEFLAYPFVSDSIDTRDFKRRYPSIKAPDFIKVKLPDLRKFEEVTVLMGLIEGSKRNPSQLIIWLAGDHHTNKVTFFIDETLDRNFRNDSRPIVIHGGKAPKKVTIYPYGKNGLPHTLFLAVPKKAPLAQKKINQARSKTNSKINNRFALSIHAGAGSGKLTYDFDNLVTGFQTWYQVKFTEKNVSMTLSYSLKYLRVGILADFQNSFYYTSYLNIRTDFPRVDVNPTTGQRIVYENVDTRINRDNHSNNRIQWGAFAALRLHITRTIEIQPTFTIGKTNYQPDHYTPRVEMPEQTFDLNSPKFMEGGLRAEFAMRNNNAVYIGFAVNKIWWQPNDYFETSFEQENLSTRLVTYKGFVGYQYGF